MLWENEPKDLQFYHRNINNLFTYESEDDTESDDNNDFDDLSYNNTLSDEELLRSTWVSDNELPSSSYSQTEEAISVKMVDDEEEELSEEEANKEESNNGKAEKE